MKNIALVSPSYGAVSETFIRRHAKVIKGNVIMYYGGEIASSNDREGLFLASGLKSVGNKIIAFMSKNFSEREVALARSLKRQKVDLLYIEYGTTAVHIIEVCKKLKLPIIVNFHGYDASVKSVIAKNKKKYLEVFSYAKEIVGVSKIMCRNLEELGCPREKISHIPCFPDEAMINLKGNASSDHINIIAVGRFVDKKAPYLTILAFSEILKSYPNANLTFIGDGPLLNTCLNLAEALALTNVKFLGAAAHDVVIEQLENSHIFLQHSITALNGDTEGTPVGIMEAMAMGLAVVSTNHAGISDVIKNGKTGILVDEKDYKGMARKVVQLIESPEYMNQLRTAAKNEIKNNYSNDEYVKKINCLIDK